jgi:hypothetical protein
LIHLAGLHAEDGCREPAVDCLVEAGQICTLITQSRGVDPGWKDAFSAMQVIFFSLVQLEKLNQGASVANDLLDTLRNQGLEESQDGWLRQIYGRLQHPRNVLAHMNVLAEGRSSVSRFEGRALEAITAAQLILNDWAPGDADGSKGRELDFIADKQGRRVGISCRVNQRQKLIGEDIQAISDAVATLGLDSGCIVSTGGYSQEALSLAAGLDIEALRFSDLPQLDEILLAGGRE